MGYRKNIPLDPVSGIIGRMNKKMNVYIRVFTLLVSACTSRDSSVDKSTLLGVDYRLFQETPAWELAKAVQDGDTVKIKQEIQKKKDLIDFREERFGQTLLGLSVSNMNYPSAKTLMELGADPNLQDSEYGDSPLMEAAKLENPISGSDPRFLKLLLKHGGDPNAMQNGPKKTRRTPLMIACEAGDLDYMKILVDAGAKVDMVNEYGSSLLESAVDAAGLYRRPEIVIYLISKGAGFKKVLYKTIEGQNKYITDGMRQWYFELGSAEYKKKLQIVDFLKRNGMDYRASEIPKEDLNNYSKEYLEKY
ncbi:ankyrin repeat domain-containing protein [Mucilaginibacter sp. BJC16-A38]|uniref:ankyrin repeat domain-containing protein n=1 Tax=Mucilaginibacter phenanthrenivorans TaxID=1234842 RepID=UPI002157068A|nr:ankyrin repeat domain-containing protein [Mucilaginibacter phenanthrenivorans]MCR8559645.1 ankyrin repeat domain-containing protein [Mucilaginibacter phenanthrenivorans]